MLDDLRKKANEALGNGDVNQAYLIICEVISSKNSTLDDLYLAAEWALDSKHYDECIGLYNQALSASITQNETWYLDSIYLGRAYAYALTDEKEEASNDMLKVSSETELSWLRNHPLINKQLVTSILTKE